MDELQFKTLFIFHRLPALPGEKPKYRKVKNEKNIMFYSQWEDTVYINKAFDCEKFDKRYPFNSAMIEDDTEGILTHESIHKVVRNQAGWPAAKRFDRISIGGTYRYWMTPP